MIHRERAYLFAFFCLLYAVTAPGDVMSDTQGRWVVARQIVETGWFAVPPGTSELSATAQDGRVYSLHAIGQSACLVPFVVAGKVVATVSTPARGDMVGQFLASVVFFPVCGALAVVLLHSIVLDATGKAPVARSVALVYGLATMHWQHTVSTSEESQVAVCLLAAIFFGQRAWRSDGLRYPLLALVAAGLGLNVRHSSVVMTAPLMIVVFAWDLAQRPDAAATVRRLRDWVLAGVAGLLPFVVLAAGYNHLRFGHPLASGYGDAFGVWVVVEGAELWRVDRPRLFGTPLLAGLSGMLLSPGKGVFIYNPILLASIPGLVMLWRSQRILVIIVAVVFTSTSLLHAKYLWWAGDITWGPRYLTSVLGVLTIGLIPLVGRPRLRPVIGALVAVSVAVQAASIVYNFKLEFLQNQHHTTIPDGYIWRPMESHLVWRFRNIGRAVTGRPVVMPLFRPEDAAREGPARFATVNVFPFKARANVGGGATAVLAALWVAMIAALTVVGYRWVRVVRGARAGPEAGGAAHGLGDPG